MACVHSCGRAAFRKYTTCCNKCVGPSGPHAADCAQKEAEETLRERCAEGVDLAEPGVARSAELDEVLAFLISCGIPDGASQSYAQILVQNGFDCMAALQTLKPEDMSLLGVKEGHMRVICEHLDVKPAASACHGPRKRPCSGGSRDAEDISEAGTSRASGAKRVKAAPKRRTSASAGPSGSGLPLDGGHSGSRDAEDVSEARTSKASGAKRVKAAPKRRTSASAGPSGSALPLDGLVICVSGTMSTVRSAFHHLLQEHGARVALSATGATTHLVTTQSEADCPTRKVLAAMGKKTHIVTEQFVHDCIANGSPVDDSPYLLVDPDSGGAPAADAFAPGSRSGRGGTKASPIRDHPGGRALPDKPTEREIVAAARGAAPAVAITSDRSSEAAARQVMLAQKWDDKLDPEGWWMSEKLDGVRGYWDGKNFYSRLGNQFPAPEWFKRGLPPTPLDGELWCGRRQFRRCLSIVRNRASGKLWEYITYLVFDAPALKKPYEERVEFIKSAVVPTGKSDTSGVGCPYAAPVGVIKCEGRDHLKRELAKVDAKGGEGLMLRQPRSDYENKRSKVLRKVKSVHDEEAKVVGHEGGRGARGFHCGALTLETPDGRQFSCGTGLSMADRASPPAIGTVVTYRFTELMDNGYPRFPVYVGPRIDLDWASICANYMRPVASDHARPELRREHSIMYSEGLLAKTLSDRADSVIELPPAAIVDDGEFMASEGSEGGETDVEPKTGRRKRRLLPGAEGAEARRRIIAEKAASAAETRASVATNGKARPRIWRGASSARLGRSTVDGEVEASSAAASSPISCGIARSRSQTLAEETGLDLEIVRGLLAEHDRASAA